MFFAFETMSICSSMSVIMFMSRRSGRTSPTKMLPSLAAHLSMYLSRLITNPITFSSERSLARKRLITRICASGFLTMARVTGSRQLADDLGIHYVRRVKGAHAKAGNINNGLQHALSAGRRPEFILVLDADFVPYRNILKRTLGLFAEPDIGIVQTPQHFFNPDPIQSNLAMTRVWPDEQRFFFNTLLDSKDAWGAAFCCGTSAVFRVDALVAAGGMATETVTEDMLTSFKFREHGYRTIFLNEMLSMGLAPEGLSSYISQRSRWCLGAIQQIYTRWSFAGPAKIGIINRLSSFDGVLYWISNSPFKLLMITAPLVYWWTQTAVISSTSGGMLCYLAPYVVCSIFFMALLCP